MEQPPMATPAGQLIHILYNNGNVGGKMGVTKKGGIGGRKALNDIKFEKPYYASNQER